MKKECLWTCNVNVHLYKSKNKFTNQKQNNKNNEKKNKQTSKKYNKTVSPDINLPKILWWDLIRAVHKQMAKNHNKLMECCEGVWAKIPPHPCERLMNS